MSEIKVISVNKKRTRVVISIGDTRFTFAKVNGEKVKKIGEETDSQIYDPENFRLPKIIFNRVCRQANAILS